MPDAPTSPPQPDQPRADSDNSSSGLKKLLLGCGCGILAMVVVCTGATAALWYTSSSMLPDDAENLVRRLAQLARQSSSSTDAGGSLASDMLAHRDIPDALGQPLDTDDATSFLNALDSFTASDAFQQQKGAADKIRHVAKAGGDAGTMDRLETIWSISDYASQTAELDKAYRQAVGGPEGGRTFFSRMIRIAALMAAADYTARQLDTSGDQPDPLSDRVASEMRERRTSLAETYDKQFRRARDIIDKQSGGDADIGSAQRARSFGEQLNNIQPALELASQPGMVAFGRLHATSFDTWADIGADQRRALVDRMREVAGLFPFANPKHGLKAFQFLLTAPERARLQPQWTR